MAAENPSWGEERIANELLLKLDIRVSPRTVSKYLSRRLWGPVCLIRRSPVSAVHLPIRAIAAVKRMSSMPVRSLAACITNTSSRRPALDLFSADHRCFQAFRSAPER
jgi:hypothetical protein